jgi:hypothetical protein
VGRDDALLGQPRLGVAHGVAQSMAIGPIVSVGLVAYLVAGAAGSAAPFVMLLVFAGTLALGWTVSLYARRWAGCRGRLRVRRAGARRAPGRPRGRTVFPSEPRHERDRHLGERAAVPGLRLIAAGEGLCQVEPCEKLMPY